MKTQKLVMKSVILFSAIFVFASTLKCEVLERNINEDNFYCQMETYPQIDTEEGLLSHHVYWVKAYYMHEDGGKADFFIAGSEDGSSIASQCNLVTQVLELAAGQKGSFELYYEKKTWSEVREETVGVWTPRPSGVFHRDDFAYEIYDFPLGLRFSFLKTKTTLLEAKL